MSGYSESFETHACGKCGTVNVVVIACAGDYRANERESVECCKCGGWLASDKCWAMYSGTTKEEAVLKLRKLQNRA